MFSKVKQRRFRMSLTVVLLFLLLLLVFSIFLGVTFGNVDLTISSVYSVIATKAYQSLATIHFLQEGFRVMVTSLFNVEIAEHFSTGAMHDVVWIIRLPRILTAVFVGMALAVSGAVMQASVKNPIADPYILGISSGASLGATLAVLLGVGHVFGAHAIGIMAFVGAAASSFLVLLISMHRSMGSSVGKLILSGMAISTLCSAIASFLIYMAHDRNATQEIIFWMMGSLGGASWDKVRLLFPIVLAGVLILWSQFKILNIILLGDDTATTLGIDVQKRRMFYLGITSLLVGLCVYVAGIIGFVGLMIPHAIRMVFGSNHRYVIPVGALVGGIFLVWADVLCRVILEHSELPIGVLISLIGAPMFIYMMFRQSYRFGGDRT